MSLIIIEKHLICQQHTQLEYFFSKSKDPIIVASNNQLNCCQFESEFNIELCNPSARRHLGLNIEA